MAIDTTKQLIDVTIQYVDNIVDPSLAEASKRTRYRQFAQELVHDFTNDYEFLWMVDEADVVPNSNGRFSLPTRFMDVGRHGGLVLKSTGEPFVDEPLKDLREMRYSPLGAGQERKFAIGMATAATETRFGWVPRGWSGQTLTLTYRRYAPVLVDDVSDTGLLEIPKQYREGLLVYGMRARAYDDKGDNRATKWEARYEMAVNNTHEAERPQKDEGLVMGGSGHADQC